MSSAFIFEVRRVGDYDKCDLKISRDVAYRTSSYNSIEIYGKCGETSLNLAINKIVASGILLRHIDASLSRFSSFQVNTHSSKFIDRFIDDRRFIQIQST